MIKLNDIKFRIGSTGKNKDGIPFATCLIYIDARTAYDELDARYGNLNWQYTWELVEGQKWAIRGILKINNYPNKEWIMFSDVGYPNESKKQSWDKNQYIENSVDDTEWLKDAVSDALKRCAVQVGIGRELYDAPFLYSEEVKVGSNGKIYGLTENGKRMIQAQIDKWYLSINTVKNGK